MSLASSTRDIESKEVDCSLLLYNNSDVDSTELFLTIRESVCKEHDGRISKTTSRCRLVFTGPANHLDVTGIP